MKKNKNYGIDIDGTLTNFEKFIYDNGVDYMRKKYQIELTYPYGYDVDETFEVADVMVLRGYNQEEAELLAKKIMSDFWNRFYLKYALLTPFRNGVKELIQEMHKNGDKVYIISSRKRTCETGLIGAIMRGTVRLQLLLNGVHYDELILCENDDEKLKVIEAKEIDVMYDDKPYIMDRLPENIDTICVNSSYNQEGEFTRKATRIDNYVDELTRFKKMNGTLKGGTVVSKGRNEFKKEMEKTERTYRILKFIAKPIVNQVFKPIILNTENAEIEGPAVVAPTHRETLDPFVIITTNNLSIHWGALKRFFDATDSIFNNSKKPFLCKLTSKLFTMIGAVPVDRDNPRAIDSIKFVKYLREDGVVGIFPESSTNKKLENKYGKFRLSKLITQEEGTHDVEEGAFRLTQKYNATLLPISIVWIPKNLDLENKVVINYRKPIKLDGQYALSELANMWLESVNEGIVESTSLVEEIRQCDSIPNQRKLIKEYK